MSYPSDFQTIQNSVIAKARLDSTADLTMVKDWINQAYFAACIETEFYESSSALAALVAGATSATIPTALIKIDYVVPTGSDGSAWGPMELIPFEDILEKRAWVGGTVSTGAPTFYAFRSASASTIEFYPNAAGGEILTFYGAQLPTALSANADLPIFPEPYATKVLESGALYEAAWYQKDLFFLQQAQSLSMEWVSRLRAFNNTRIGNKTQQFKVAGQPLTPRGNSVDIR